MAKAPLCKGRHAAVREDDILPYRMGTGQLRTKMYPVLDARTIPREIFI